MNIDTCKYAPYRASFVKKVRRGKVPFFGGWGRIKELNFAEFRKQQKKLAKKQRAAMSFQQFFKNLFLPAFKRYCNAK